MKLVSKRFPKVEYSDLKKMDKKAVAIVDSFFNDNAKGKKIELPLTSSVDLEKDKLVSVDVASLVRIQYAIFTLSSLVFTYEERKDKDGKSYNVYFVEQADELKGEYEFYAPKKSQVKRESSKKTAEKAQAKKAEAEATAKTEADALADDFAKKHTKKILDLVCGKYGLKLDNVKYCDLEKDLIAILKM